MSAAAHYDVDEQLSDTGSLRLTYAATQIKSHTQN